MSMGVGLEVRVPFCDHRIMEYVYNIPWEIKSYGEREKGLLRFAMQDILPPGIAWRKKSPYPKTHNPAYLAAVRYQVQNILDDKGARLFEILERAQVQELADTGAKSFNKPWYGQLMTDAQVLAYLIQLEHWLKTFDVELV